MWSSNWSGRVLLFFFVSAAIVVCGSCSGAVSSGATTAAPRLSLIGVPDRPISFELRITGHDMDTMVHAGISRSSGEILLQVPAGRDRRFTLIAENDVYTGHTVASLAGGQETRVRIPVHPGPVFVSRWWGQEEVEPGIVQIRDLHVDVEGMLDETDGRIRFLSEGNGYAPFAVQYGADGALWVASIPGEIDCTIERWTEWGVRPETPVTLEAYMPQCFAVDTDRGVLTVWDSETTSEPVLYTLTGEPLDQSFSPGGDGAEDFYVTSMAGLAFDRNGNLWGLGLVEQFDGETWTYEPSIIRFDVAAGLISHSAIPDTLYIPDTYYSPWGDIRAVGNNVYVLIASYPPEAGSEDFGLMDPDALNELHHPAVYRYNLNMELQESWGRRVTVENPLPGEFWGPRQFVATRFSEDIIIIDQKDFLDDTMYPNIDGAGRVVRFRPGSSQVWETFGVGSFGYFDTYVHIGGALF